MSIPLEREKAYQSVSQALTMAHVRWRLFTDLYAVSDKRVELLNWAASTFFENLKYLLIDSVILTLTKLNDPESSGRHPNVSLRYLVTTVKENAKDGAPVELERLLDEFSDACTPLEEHRNKRIAHFDRGQRLDPTQVPLPDLSIEVVENAMQKAEAITRAVEVHYGAAVIVHSEVTVIAGADQLVSRLIKAHAFDQCMTEDHGKAYEVMQRDEYFRV